jgi:predicted HTH transcriptional regulator
MSYQNNRQATAPKTSNATVATPLPKDPRHPYKAPRVTEKAIIEAIKKKPFSSTRDLAQALGTTIDSGSLRGRLRRLVAKKVISRTPGPSVLFSAL